MSQATETTIRRGPWRPRESTERAWRRRYLRRGIFTAATLLLVVLLLYLLLRPFWHPDTKLVILTAPEYAVGTAAPLSFSRQEAGGLEALRPALYHDRGAEAPLVLPSLTSPGRVDSLADQLQVIRTGGSDVLLLYIAAHGLVLDGEPYLMCQDFDASQPLAGMVRLSDLLRQVDRSPARVKLLILDSGQLAYEPRLGLLVNEFPRLLPAALAAVRDPADSSRGKSSSLWVLNSNSAGERSHVSRALQRTVFGFFVSEGLKGAADLNGDKLVDVGELHRFVATHVSSWVNRYSAGNETQTPLLLSSDESGRLARGYPELLSIAAFPRDERNLDLGRSLYLARESSRTLSYFTGSSLPVNEYSLMMRATSPLYHSRAGGTLLRGYYASRYARTAAQAAPLPSAGAEAGAAAEAAAPAAGGVPTGEGTPVGDAPGAEGADEEAETGPSPLIKEIGDLLTEGWTLRDTLRDDLRLEGPADFAPHLIRQFEAEWLGYEALFRAGALEDERAFAVALRGTLELLRHVTGTAPAGALPPDPVAVRAWAGSPLKAPAAHALGLAEQLAERRQVKLSDELRQVIADLDRLADGGTRPELQEWLGKRSPAELQFAELQLASQLAADDQLPWPLVQQALRTRRLGERIAAAHPRLVRWVAAQLEQADRLRLRGERALRDQVGADSDQVAGTLLADAARLYETADSDMQWVREAIQADIRLSQRLPVYTRWRSRVGADAGGNAPAQVSLIQLADSLEQLAWLLDKPAPAAADLQALRRLVGQLRRQEALVSGGLEPDGVQTLLEAPPREGSSWRVEAMLDTAAPELALRTALLAASDQIDVQLTERYQLPVIPATTPAASSLTPERWQWLQRQAELEVRICRLAAARLPGAATGALAQVEAAWLALQQPASAEPDPAAGSSEDDGKWLAHRRLGSAVERFYAELPASILSTTRQNEDLRDLASRPEQLARLRAAVRALRWLAPQDAARLGGAEPSRVLQRADYFDDWAWQLRRLRIAEAFAAPPERSQLAPHFAAYQTPPETLDDQPSLRADTRPRVQLESPATLSLMSQSERDITLTVTNSSAQQLACWVVLEYDPEVLQVTALRDELPLYRQPPGMQFAAVSAAPGAETAVAPATITLSAGSRQTLSLRVRRAEQPPRGSRLLVKLVADPLQRGTGSRWQPVSAADLSGMLPASADEPVNVLAGRISDSAAYLRQDVDVQVPSPSHVSLQVVGRPGTWSRVDQGYLLHPFPNRQSQYALSLMNRSGRQRSVDVELYTLEQRVAVDLPDAGLVPQLAERYLQQLGSLRLLQSLAEVAVPSGGQPVPLNFPAPAEGAAAAEAAPAAGQSEPGAEASQSDLPLAGDDVNQGLLVVIRDRQSGESTLRRLDFAPQRPRRYVRVEVGYNLNAEQLHVTVTGQSPDLLPADGVKVRAEIVEPLPQNVQARLEGELQAPNYQAVLYANIPAVPRRTVTLRVHVDDYPRAFVFRVPCGVHSRSLPEEEHLMQVRIVSPQANTAFQAPVESVRVRAEVDAPVGTFENGNDLVEIGLDEDLDREFRSDAPLRFHNDRQADVRLTGLRPGGLLLVQSRVRDFVVDVPGNGLQNVRVNVLGRLFVRQKTAWSLPVPISLDAAAPRLARVKTASGNQAIIGQPLLVTVWSDGEDLSLMGGVEAAFDTERTGEFPAAPPPVSGKPVGDGRWEITLPTEQLAPGKHNILLRARDRVGNQGKILSYEVQAVPEAELQKQRETLVLVTGRVLYREQPVPGATVALKAADGKEYGPVQSDEQGQYRIENVPVGSYQVDARGVVRNTPRFPAEPITFEIKPGDPRLKRLDIPIRPNRAPGNGAEPR